MEKEETKVVYIITKLELGGAQKVCLSLFYGLREQNIQTYLISSNSGLLTHKIKNENNTILMPELVREINLFKIINEIKTFFNLFKYLKKIKRDNPNIIVHTHSTKAGIIGRWAALFAGIRKRVHTIHGFAFHGHQNIFVWTIIYLIELITSLITTHYVCVSSVDVKNAIKLFPKFNKFSC